MIRVSGTTIHSILKSEKDYVMNYYEMKYNIEKNSSVEAKIRGQLDIINKMQYIFRKNEIYDAKLVFRFFDQEIYENKKIRKMFNENTDEWYYMTGRIAEYENIYSNVYVEVFAMQEWAN